MADLFFPSRMATIRVARSGQSGHAGAPERTGFNAVIGDRVKGDSTPNLAGPFNSFATMATVG